MKSLKFGAVLATLALLAVGSVRADEESDLDAQAQTALAAAATSAGQSTAALASAYCSRNFASSGLSQPSAKYTLAKQNAALANDPDTCALIEGYLTAAGALIDRAIGEYSLADAANLTAAGNRVSAGTLYDGRDFGGAIVKANQAVSVFGISITNSNACAGDSVAAGNLLIEAMGLINPYLPPPPGGG